MTESNEKLKVEVTDLKKTVNGTTKTLLTNAYKLNEQQSLIKKIPGDWSNWKSDKLTRLRLTITGINHPLLPALTSTTCRSYYCPGPLMMHIYMESKM